MGKTSCTLFLHFQQDKTPAVHWPYLFSIFNIYLILAVLIQQNLNCTLFQHFQWEKNPSCSLLLLLEQCNTPVALYFIIFNTLELHQHLISGFLMEENSSRTLFFTIWPPRSKDAFLAKPFYYIFFHFILEIYYGIDKGSS